MTPLNSFETVEGPSSLPGRDSYANIAELTEPTAPVHCTVNKIHQIIYVIEAERNGAHARVMSRVEFLRRPRELAETRVFAVMACR